MTPTRSFARSTRNPRSGALLALGILLLSGLAFVPSASAAAGSFTIEMDDQAGAVCPKTSVVTGPTGTCLGTIAGPKQAGTQRTLTISENSGCAVSQVAFTAPALSGGKGIEFDPGISESFGFDVSQGEARTLYFDRSTSIPGLPDFKSGKADFTIGFNVVGQPVADQVFSVTVALSYKAGSACTIAEQTYNIRIETTTPSFTASLPAVTLDTDQNGHLDRMTLTFNRLMDESTFDVNEWKVQGFTITKFEFEDTNPLSTPFLASTDTRCPNAFFDSGSSPMPVAQRTGIYGCTELTFYLAERFNYDTGVKPPITFKKGTFADLAGNLMPDVTGTSVTIVDQAAPVLVGALAYEIGLEPTGADSALDAVRLTWSEDVRANEQQFSAPAVTPEHLFYIDCNPDPDNSVARMSVPLTGKLIPTKDTGCFYNGDGRAGGWMSDMGTTGSSGGVEHKTTSMSVMIVKLCGGTDAIDPSDAEGACGGLGTLDVKNNFGDRICARDPRDQTPSTAAIDYAEERIRDFASRPTIPTNCMYLRTPELLQAEVNIDSFRLTLQFNGPVSDGASDTTPIQASKLDIRSSSCTSAGDCGGPKGVLSVTHIAGTDQAVVVLDGRVNKDDVDRTPTKICFDGAAIKATGTAGFVPGGCYNLVDRTPPAITAAHTVDVNGNGVIDGMFLEFNEPVNDASFCDFDTSCYVSPAAAYSAVTQRYTDEDGTKPFYDLTPYGVESKVAILVNVPAGVQPVTGPFLWDTGGRSDCGDLEDCGANDRFGVLRWPEQDVPGLHAGTGVVPDLMVRSYAPVLDDSDVEVPVADLRPLFQDFSQVCDFTTGSGSSVTCSGANAMKPLLTGDLKETDGAPPIVLAAETLDAETKPVGTAAPNVACRIKLPALGTKSCAPDPNGFLDGYRVTFSEKVNDASFVKDQWKVGDGTAYVVQSATTGNRVTDGPNDHVLHVVFDSADTPDTDARPELTYTKPGAKVTVDYLGLTDPGMKDRSGIPMNSFGEAAVTEVDRAVPVIVEVKGLAGQSTLDITFSEGVEDAEGAGSLVRRNFVYSNQENACAERPGETGASGFSSVEVQHVGGAKTARITVNKALCAADLTKDTIAASGTFHPEGLDLIQDGTIRESAPSLPIAERQFVLPTAKKLNLAPDSIAPEQITNLGVDLTTANSVRVSFTAPGDDGKGNGKVAKYVVKVSPDQISESTFAAVVNDATLVFTPDLADPTKLVEAGEKQQITVTGLKTTTKYYLAVVAEDDASVLQADGKTTGANRGKVSNIVSFDTKEDITGPIGEPPLVTSNIPRSTPTTRKDANFGWNTITDQESVVTYHYRLDTSPETTVTKADPSVTATSLDQVIQDFGTYYFHVRACSAGGCQPSATHYGPMLIQPPVLAQGDIEILDLELEEETYARRVGGENVINWTVPADLPDNVDLVGFEVFRLEDGAWVRIAELPATASNYTDADGGKNDRYLVTLKFAGHPEAQKIVPTASDFTGASVRSGGSDNLWILIVVAVAAGLALCGLLAFLLLRKRGAGAAGAALAQEGFVAQEQGPAGTDEASGLPTHEVTCPTCSTAFQAVGNLPLQITCPSCGATGALN